MINVFGGNGFIGSRYCELTPTIIKNDRDDYNVQYCEQILYFISTVDNYNVFTDPYIDIETNLTTLIKVLESCKDKDIVFNFVSSWFVYGDVELPAKEDSYCNPRGFYSITKRTAEQLLVSYCETFGIKYRILRLANVLGETDSKVSTKKNALQYLISELKCDNELKLYDGGYLFRDYIYIDDVISAINIIIEKGDINTIYNVGNGKPIYLIDILSKAKYLLNSTSIFTSVEQADFHKIVQTKNMVLNVDKLKSLGYTEKYDINDIIKILIK